MREEECEKKIADMPQIMKSVYVHNVKYFFFLFITFLENTIIQSRLIVFLMSLVWQANTLPNSLFLYGMTEKMAKSQAQKQPISASVC